MTPRRTLVAALLVVAAACADSSSPRQPDVRPVPLDGPTLAPIVVSGGEDSDPPPPPIDTLSAAVGDTPSLTFQLIHRATFTSDLAGTMGWIAWGSATQPKGTRVEGSSQVYYGKGYLRGTGVVRISDARGALTIDFAKQLDTTSAVVTTTCSAKEGGACATLGFRNASYTPTGGVAARASGKLLVGIPSRQ